jgi:hydrogenase expression/formation protein HypD
MRYIDEFRDAAAARGIRLRLDEHAAALRARGRRATIMEVCGSHTMAIARYGIRSVLPDVVRLVSGPGCPVCVTDTGYIDAALALAERGITVATFGDMLNVPGSDSSLARCRAAGGSVLVCYSPTQAFDHARAHPDREVVFLAIGFETTVAPIAALIHRAATEGVPNLSFLTAFKTVPPALAALGADPEIRIDAFLCPAHVSAIIGADAYRPFSGPGGVPCVIAGFEPLDILLGIDGILAQLAAGEARVENQYSRVVTPEGNPRALALMSRYLQPADAHWRGIGTIPASGLDLRPEFQRLDAAVRHGVAVTAGRSHPGCMCGDVLKGKHEPPDCRLFGRGCTPDHPIGPCMVSSEGTCAAWFKYARGALA